MVTNLLLLRNPVEIVKLLHTPWILMILAGWQDILNTNQPSPNENEMKCLDSRELNFPNNTPGNPPGLHSVEACEP